jgi:serine/threonine protein kinase
MPHHTPTLRSEPKLPQGRRGLAPSTAWAQRVVKKTNLLAGRTYHLGAAMGRLYVEHKLGQGAQGAVWAVRSALLPGPLALKVIDLQHTDRSALSYALALQRRCHSPFVVTAHEAQMSAHTAFILTERVMGSDLETYLCQRAQRPSRNQLSLLLTLFDAMVQAVSACHAQGVIHRDIKPENFMVCAPQKGPPYVKLADFDLATQRSTGQTAGTVTYLAPEALAGGPVGFPADIWSLGISLYRMVVGIEPFYDDDETRTAQAIVQQQPTSTLDDLKLCLSMHQPNPATARALVELVADCLHPTAQARPTCAELHLRLHAIRA